MPLSLEIDGFGRRSTLLQIAARVDVGRRFRHLDSQQGVHGSVDGRIDALDELPGATVGRWAKPLLLSDKESFHT